jgi:uncharacterized C2H2 Zn-finger protein
MVPAKITFECEKCGMLFNSKREVDLHSEQKHPEYKYVNK